MFIIMDRFQVSSYLVLAILSAMSMAQDGPCMLASTAGNTALLKTSHYPRLFSTHDCRCTFTAISDLDLRVEVNLEEKDHREGTCNVQMLRMRGNHEVMTCPTTEGGNQNTQVAYFGLHEGETMTLNLKNSQKRCIAFSMELEAAQEKGRFELSCETGSGGHGLCNETDNAAARNPDNNARGAITGAVVGVVIIIVIIIIVLLAALIKMNIDKARKRKQKEKLAESSNNVNREHGENYAFDGVHSRPSMDPAGVPNNTGFVNIGYTSSYGPSSVDPSTRGSTPVGFADLGGPMMGGSSLPPSTRGSTHSVGSFFAGNPSYGSRSSLSGQPELGARAGEVRPIQPAGRDARDGGPGTGPVRPTARLPIQPAGESSRPSQPSAQPVRPAPVRPAGPAPPSGPQPAGPNQPVQPDMRGPQPPRGPALSSSNVPTPNYPYRGPSEEPTPRIQPSTGPGTHPSQPAAPVGGGPPQPKPTPGPAVLDLRDYPRRPQGHLGQPLAHPPQPAPSIERPPIEVTRISSTSDDPRRPYGETPLTNIPRQPPRAVVTDYYPSPFNREAESDVDSARFATAPTSPLASPTYGARGATETTI